MNISEVESAQFPVCQPASMAFGIGGYSHCHQALKMPQAFVHVGDVLVKHGIDGTTTVLRMISKTQQGVDFLVAHDQCAAIADEAQTRHMVWPVHSEMARSACRPWPQAVFS